MLLKGRIPPQPENTSLEVSFLLFFFFRSLVLGAGYNFDKLVSVSGIISNSQKPTLKPLFAITVCQKVGQKVVIRLGSNCQKTNTRLLFPSFSMPRVQTLSLRNVICSYTCSPPAAEYALASCLRASWERVDCSRYHH